MIKILAICFCLLSTPVLAVSPALVAYALQEKGEAVIIDIREEKELQEGMVKGAKWFPLSRLKQDENWVQDFKSLVKNQKIYLYCRSGRRVKEFQTALSKQSLAKGINLGGLAELSQLLPIVKP